MKSDVYRPVSASVTGQTPCIS